MQKLQSKIPVGYQSKLSLLETEFAIKHIKDFFQSKLSERLNLIRASAPLFVRVESGLNDNLNGVERPVGFEHENGRLEVVQSLAKWKRMALARYKIPTGQGLYTDMNAIRRDEELDNLHSMYVDQWDWEKVISKEMRNEKTLKSVVIIIYSVFRDTADYMSGLYPQLVFDLPHDITFITAQELEDMYPEMTPKERENAITRKLKAVFIQGIGHDLISGKPHDGRAPDYDDWRLNGDIIFWNDTLEQAFELSSMGIRVDESAMMEQLKIRGAEERLSFDYHKALMAGELPYTIGGGIGQSRICMYLLQKAHIGEVQASVWDRYTLDVCEQAGVALL